MNAEDAELLQDFQKEYGETHGISREISLKDAGMYAGPLGKNMMH